MSDLITPCHGAQLLIVTTVEGHVGMTSDVPSEIMCGFPACLNSWAPNGVADYYNKPQEATQ